MSTRPPLRTAGTYTVTLTVTDDDGATEHRHDDVTVTVPPPPARIAFRAATAPIQRHEPRGRTHAVQTGDQLVLFLTTNTAATATTPSGWTLLGTGLDGTDLRSWAYTRAAGRARQGRRSA